MQSCGRRDAARGATALLACVGLLSLVPAAGARTTPAARVPLSVAKAAANDPTLLPPGTVLPDGFVVAPGTRLIGAAFPSTYAKVGWEALLLIDRDQDPIEVYDAYVQQARDLGLLLPGSGGGGDPVASTCHFLQGKNLQEMSPYAAATDTADVIECRSYTTRIDSPELATTANLAVRWGQQDGSSYPPARHVYLSVSHDPPDVIEKYDWETDEEFNQRRLEEEAMPVPVDAGFVQAGPHRVPAIAHRRLVQKPGTPFGAKNNAFAAGYRRFHLEPGSRLAAPEAFNIEEYDFIAVLQVEGDPMTVMKGYARQLGVEVQTLTDSPLTPGTPAQPVLFIANEPEGGGYGTLMTDPSGKWIMVKTQSD